MKTALIIGMIILVLFIVFLWMFIAGADESKLRNGNRQGKKQENNNRNQQ